MQGQMEEMLIICAQVRSFKYVTAGHGAERGQQEL